MSSLNRGSPKHASATSSPAPGKQAARRATPGGLRSPLGADVSAPILDGFAVDYTDGGAGGRGGGRAEMAPLDMQRAGLLPDDRVLVALTGTPLWSGQIWPAKRVPVGSIRLPILRVTAGLEHLEVPTSGRASVELMTLRSPHPALARACDASELRIFREHWLPWKGAHAPAPRFALQELLASLSGAYVPRESHCSFRGEAVSVLAAAGDGDTGGAYFFFIAPECGTRCLPGFLRSAPRQRSTAALLGDGAAAATSGAPVAPGQASSASTTVPCSPTSRSGSGNDEVVRADAHVGGPAVNCAPATNDTTAASAAARGPCIGGLESELGTLRDLASSVLFPPPALARLRIKPPRGALLVGPPGTGKTLLARVLAADLCVPLHIINGPEVMSSIVGEAEAELRRRFDACAEEGPALLFIDEIDGLCPSRETSGEVEARVVATMLALLDDDDGEDDDNDSSDMRGAGALGRRYLSATGSGVSSSAAADLIALPESLQRATAAPPTIAIAASCSPVKAAATRANDTFPSLLSSSAGEAAGGDIALVTAAGVAPSSPDVRLRRLESAGEMVTPLQPQIVASTAAAAAAALSVLEVSSALDGLSQAMGALTTSDSRYQTRSSTAPTTAVAAAGAAGLDESIARKSAPSLQGTFELIPAASVMHGDNDSALSSPPHPQRHPPTTRRRRQRIFVLGATNRVSSLDPSLRRPGRFDREIEVGIPSARGRQDILRACLRGFPCALPDGEITALAGKLHGYVGADIASLCREAAGAALRRIVDSQLASSTGAGGGSSDDASQGNVTMLPLSTSSSLSPSAASAPAARFLDANLTRTDFEVALRTVQPSALREIAVEVPNVSWSDIGGQAEAKQALKEAVEWPLTHPEAFLRMGIRPPKGLLMYGPPGCSKTMMAKAMATEGRMNFIAVKGPELFSKYVGDSEKAVAEVFRRARAASPCIVFFDEFDALAASRAGSSDGDGGGSNVLTRVVAQLLTELDGIVALQQVVVVAATNRPDLIDAALLRPGRIDRMLYVGLPDAAARRRIVQLQLARVPHDLAELSDAETTFSDAELEGYSGAEIVGIFRDAAVRAVAEERVDPVLRLRHLRAAAAAMPRQVTPDMLAFYARFARRV